MARINVEQQALSDPRFLRFGRLLGCGPQLAHEAGLAIMIRIWNELTERWSEEAGPKAYAIGPQALRDLFAGRAVASRLPRALTESGLAEETEFGLRIRGTYGRIEWLNRRREAARDNGKLGGRKPKSVNPLSPALSPAPSPAQVLRKEPLPNPRNAALGGWRDLFPEFWEVYPRKVAKKAAEKAWQKLAPATPDLIEPTALGIAYVLRDRKRVDWAGRDPDRIPYPATFLNAEKFEVQHEAV